ncbi:cytochrome P450 [Mycobacterium sp. PSTR-4-N]|uniref:cytochrome P450 n=1 Tax=Mycobacterium sp. PSTR-4-N TaxID=2917745 RepID=UPI001F152891|nr:cytochrome P450 [Mycobacterium sp. PSTR-4-N]MCG7594553.1 cytochrome P450 [Mycobacterium sp. PSTR-4-N]
MGNGLATWMRWTALHGIPRAVLSSRARRGEPMATLSLGRDDPSGRLRRIEEIRAAGPLARTPLVLVSADHAVCRSVLRDNDFVVADPAETGLPEVIARVMRRLDPGLPNPVESPSMLMTDPPEHTGYRKMVSRSFTPRAIATLDSRIDELTLALLDGLDGRDEVDLISDYAAQVPAAVISDLLGVPIADRQRILRWGNRIAPLLDIGITWSAYHGAITELRDVEEYLLEHFRRLRAEGSDGTPFSTMALEGGLTDRVLRANAALLVGAGVETTVNLIGNGIVALMNHPDQLALLRDDPDLWPSAVEEMLRFDSPVQMTAREASRDTEIAGVPIPRGTAVVLLLGGANRDPQVFDQPDRFDITRPNAREHLAFGSGIHVCLGAALARNEAVTALRALFDRYPDLQLCGAPEHRGLVNLNGYRRMTARLRHEAVTRTAS